MTMGKIADILQAHGDLDDALRSCHEDVLPVFERLGDVRSLSVGLASYAQMLLATPTGARILEARTCLRQSVAIADRLGLPFPDELHDRLAQARAVAHHVIAATGTSTCRFRGQAPGRTSRNHRRRPRDRGRTCRHPVSSEGAVR
jgi:hypothetical protein